MIVINEKLFQRICNIYYFYCFKFVVRVFFWSNIWCINWQKQNFYFWWFKLIIYIEIIFYDCTIKNCKPLEKDQFLNLTCGSIFELHCEILDQNIKIYLMTIYNIMFEIYKWGDRKKNRLQHDA